MSLSSDIEDIVARAKTYEKTASAPAKQLSSSPTIGKLRTIGGLLRQPIDGSYTTKIATVDVAQLLGK